jgi:hypothetical protein
MGVIDRLKIGEHLGAAGGRQGRGGQEVLEDDRDPPQGLPGIWALGVESVCVSKGLLFGDMDQGLEDRLGRLDSIQAGLDCLSGA